MSGVKGRSGGKREGAGRKPQPSVPAPDDCADVLDFLRKTALGRVEASPTQVQAAAQFLKFKTGAGEGKKDQRKRAAHNVVHGKFSAAPPPLRLVK